MITVFWLAGGNMNKFHAFRELRLRSLCDEWLREGTISSGVKWSRKLHKQNQKCSKCLKELQTKC